MKKEIVIVTQWLSYEGGVSKSLVDMLFKNANEDINFTLVLTSKTKKLYNVEELPYNVKVIELKNSLNGLSRKHLMNRILKNLNVIKLVSSFIRLFLISIAKELDLAKLHKFISQYEQINSEHFDVAISWGMPDSYCNTYVIKCINASKKYMWVHADVSAYMTKDVMNFENLYNEYDKIFCVSETTAKSFLNLIKIDQSKVGIAFNTLNSNKIIRDSKINIYDLNLNETRFTFCTVARVCPDKGIELILDTCEILNSEKINYKWLIIGKSEDDYMIKLKQIIADKKLCANVIFLGQKNNPYPYMLKSDIYVQASKHEGYPITVQEAKILEKVIICTNYKSACEQITHRVNGSIVEYSSQRMADEICYLINNPKMCSQYVHSLNINSNKSGRNPKLLELIN